MKKFKVTKRKPKVSQSSKEHLKQKSLIDKKIKYGDAFTGEDINFITNWNLAHPTNRIDISITRKIVKKDPPVPKTLIQKISDLTQHFNSLSREQIAILELSIKSKIKKQEDYSKFDFAFIKWKGDEYILKLAQLKISTWRELEPFERKVYTQWKKENKERRAKKKQLRKNTKLDATTFEKHIIPMLIKKFGQHNIRQSTLGFLEIKKDERIFRYYQNKSECEINKQVVPMPLDKFCNIFLKEFYN
jgi:hypothetical protein